MTWILEGVKMEFHPYLFMLEIISLTILVYLPKCVFDNGIWLIFSQKEMVLA